MRKVFNFLSKIIEDFFILLGLYFISKASFLVYMPLGYFVIGVFFMVLGLLMLRRR